MNVYVLLIDFLQGNELREVYTDLGIAKARAQDFIDNLAAEYEMDSVQLEWQELHPGEPQWSRGGRLSHYPTNLDDLSELLRDAIGGCIRVVIHHCELLGKLSPETP